MHLCYRVAWAMLCDPAKYQSMGTLRGPVTIKSNPKNVYSACNTWSQDYLAFRKLFQKYIKEDVYFLDVFALALMVAINKARNSPVAVTRMLTDLHSGIAEELKLHKGYQEQLCQDSADRKAGHEATSNYTEFLMKTAQTEVHVLVKLSALLYVCPHIAALGLCTASVRTQYCSSQ